MMVVCVNGNEVTVLLDTYVHEVSACHLLFVRHTPYKLAKVKLLFPYESHAMCEHLKLDDVSLYSVTDQHAANITAQHILQKVEGASPRTAVIDGTSCVGGNAFAFARLFSHVYAVEIHRERAQMLRHNAFLLRVHNMTVHEGDFCKVHGTLPDVPRDDTVVFLDPPWGGHNYKKRANLRLWLSDENISSICAKLAGQYLAVAIKVPPNFDFRHFAILNPQYTRVSISPKICLVLVSTREGI
jgi:16S rRNA G966 N2-methylase RsmD